MTVGGRDLGDQRILRRVAAQPGFSAGRTSVGEQRMRQAGMVITSTEMVIYELLQRAGTDEFRSVLPLVK